MTKIQISLNSIDKVKAFVNTIFSLDLSKPIELAIHSEKDVDAILQALEPYTI